MHSRSDFDHSSIWHPYSSLTSPQSTLKVVAASGACIELDTGDKLIDGMSSWWSVIHGYNHPVLNDAAKNQLDKFSHVMFGGLSHEPAEQLCEKLIDITPNGLDTVFLCDTGSVAVEVALKMAAQYWRGAGKPDKKQFIALQGGYHGDTRSAMSVSDPDTGMHNLFTGIICQQNFLDRPPAGFEADIDEDYLDKVEQEIEALARTSAALILEPIVQGAGGMYFYSPKYLRALSQICKRNDLLLIADEIATGFGRAGKLFASEYADVRPDILCLGKAMTGGYLTQAATLCSKEVAEGICSSEAGVFMHGPTFMANPLASAISLASITLLQQTDWQANVRRIEQQLATALAGCETLPNVQDVRVLGAIGVIETKEPVDLQRINPTLLAEGVWLRPFGKLIYTMPPYICSNEQIVKIASTMKSIAALR